MGPRLFSRGNAPKEDIEPATLVELQWGHDFSAVEISGGGGTVITPHVASMGPRLFSRGNKSQKIGNEHSGPALQWGHDFSAVEMGST